MSYTTCDTSTSIRTLVPSRFSEGYALDALSEFWTLDQYKWFTQCSIYSNSEAVASLQLSRGTDRPTRAPLRTDRSGRLTIVIERDLTAQLVRP